MSIITYSSSESLKATEQFKSPQNKPLLVAKSAIIRKNPHLESTRLAVKVTSDDDLNFFGTAVKHQDKNGGTLLEKRTFTKYSRGQSDALQSEDLSESTK
jgi:hypothetical protein